METGFALLISAIVAVLVSVIIGYLIAMHNSLVHLRNVIKKSRERMDTLRKQRFHELPKLIECVKNPMKREKHLLENLAQAQVTMRNAETREKSDIVDKKISEMVSLLLIASQRYPKLEKDTRFRQIHHHIVSIENKLQHERALYTNASNVFHTRSESFPDVIIASWLKLTHGKKFNAH